MRRIRAFILHHDDSRAFVWLYLGLAVILSLWARGTAAVGAPA